MTFPSDAWTSWRHYDVWIDYLQTGDTYKVLAYRHEYGEITVRRIIKHGKKHNPTKVAVSAKWMQPTERESTSTSTRPKRSRNSGRKQN